MAKSKKPARVKGTGDISDRVGQAAAEILINKILDGRKVRDDGSRLTDADGVDFDLVEWDSPKAKLFVQPRHVTVDEVSEYANSSCRDCNSKGYMVVNIVKALIQNPGQYVILSRKSLEGLDDEQKKQVIEEEAKHPMWRVLLPCHCALKRARAKMPNFFSNKDGSVMFAVEWEEEEEKETEEK